MEQDFKAFIDERINHNYINFRKSDEWKNDTEMFEKTYYNLYNQLTTLQQHELDKILSLKNTLISSEKYFAYKIGINDAIKLFNL